MRYTNCIVSILSQAIASMVGKHAAKGSKAAMPHDMERDDALTPLSLGRAIVHYLYFLAAKTK
jgi:hypothetical protein